ncbi:hypothetical protein GDO78_001262 [Eleutherodactylus coqui]|uniref:Secreted protein n=1 Tax=Eleutherodactylus coqui TaxID=57060 RepID=A0A8J6KIT7_ELECQ|nr:hypothetical protein GDO78_001262 [Eleutherodactylus coqui]
MLVRCCSSLLLRQLCRSISASRMWAAVNILLSAVRLLMPGSTDMRPGSSALHAFWITCGIEEGIYLSLPDMGC